MAFTDPVSLTIDGTAYSLPRTSTSGNRGRYSTADGLIAVTADHQYGSRYRHVLRVDHSKVTPDPFIPAQNSKVGMNHYLIFDYPPGGYTNTEVLKFTRDLRPGSPLPLTLSSPSFLVARARRRFLRTTFTAALIAQQSESV